MADSIWEEGKGKAVQIKPYRSEKLNDLHCTVNTIAFCIEHVWQTKWFTGVRHEVFTLSDIPEFYTRTRFRFVKRLHELFTVLTSREIQITRTCWSIKSVAADDRAKIQERSRVVAWNGRNVKDVMNTHGDECQANAGVNGQEHTRSCWQFTLVCDSVLVYLHYVRVKDVYGKRTQFASGTIETRRKFRLPYVGIVLLT